MPNIISLKEALIIFVRNPLLGKVKSRLAETTGEEKALEIYNMLLAHTHFISRNIFADKFVFYEDFVNQNDLWENDIYTKFLQEGNDLGSRMKNAFDTLYKKGYTKVLIIGSDCYELSKDIITEAFNTLSKIDIVIGPATDGGYYLLGMNTFIPELFDNKTWSSSTVYDDTINQINDLKLSVSTLRLLNDVDVESDIDFDELNRIIASSPY